jgi:hypothetical protein
LKINHPLTLHREWTFTKSGKNSENRAVNKKTSLVDSDINKKKSRKKGLAGVFENLFRDFPQIVSFLSSAPLIFIYITCIALACVPGISLTIWIYEMTASWGILGRAILMAFAFSTGAFLFVISLIFIVPIFNLPFLLMVRRNGKYRGPWFSVQTVPWYLHNAMIYLVRYTVLDFITPSILNEIFFRMMGMKIGKNVLINSSNISDACMIELEDNVTIGGSAVLMSHYAMHGLLVIDKLKIKKNTTVGLNAIIMGGSDIGEKVTIAPAAVVLPKSKVEDGGKFGFKDA